MSSETSSVILSICGIAAVVGVLILLAGLLLVQVFKMSIFGTAMMVMRIFTEGKTESSDPDVQAQLAERPRSRDLRARAQSADFDAAVARHATTSTQSVSVTPTQPSTGTFSAQAAPLEPRTRATDEIRSARDRRRKRESEENEDMFMDFLGDD